MKNTSFSLSKGLLIRVGLLAVFFFGICRAQQSGLVLHWTFDENSGTTCADGSANGNTGKISGSPNRTQGLSGNALMFDGIDDRIEASASSSLDNLQSEVTIAFWFKIPDRYDTKLRFVAGKPVGFVGPGFSIGHRADIHTFKIYGAEDAARTYSNIFPKSNWWYHFVVVIQGTATAICINGEYYQVVGKTGLGNHSGLPLNVGGKDGAFFKGALDDFRIYNRALSGTEVRALYDSYTKPSIDATIIRPAEGRTVNKGSDVLIQAKVAVSNGATVSKLEFFNGSNKISTITAFPWTCTFKNAIAPNYAFSVNAIDNKGNQSADTVRIRVEPYSLLARYAFDETGGNVAHDSSGNKRDAAVAFVPGTQVWDKGWKSGGLRLFGDGKSYFCADSARAMIQGNISFSIGLWIKTTQPEQSLFAQYETIKNSGFWLNMIENGKLEFGNYGVDEFYILEDISRKAVNDGAWHHILVKRASDDMGDKGTIYIDGVIDAGDRSSFGIPGGLSLEPADFIIGQSWRQTHGDHAILPPYNGVIDDLRFYNWALSDADVQKIFAGQTIPYPAIRNFSKPGVASDLQVQLAGNRMLISNQGRAAFLKVRLYNISGQLLNSAFFDCAGRICFDLGLQNGMALPSGRYHVAIENITEGGNPTYIHPVLRIDR